MQRLFPHLLLRQWVIPQITLQSDEYDRYTGTTITGLFDPLGTQLARICSNSNIVANLVFDIVQRIWRIYRKADKNDVSFRIGKRS